MGPGTVPLKLQNLYCTPSAKVPTYSLASTLTTTLAGPFLVMGAGTFGKVVSCRFNCWHIHDAHAVELSPVRSQGHA